MKILIAVDAGHGDTPGADGYDPGAVSKLGRHEAKHALATALTVKTVAEARGFDVWLTRDGTAGRKPDLYQRVQGAIKRGAKAFVSVHYNCDRCGSAIYRSPGSASRRLASLAGKALGISRVWPSSESRFGGLYPDGFPDARPAIMLEPAGIEAAPAIGAAGRAARLTTANDTVDALELYFYGVRQTQRLQPEE